jgi:hypothetical protein
MAVLTMTGTPPQGDEIPTGFALSAAGDYRIAGKTRYISMFSPLAEAR